MISTHAKIIFYQDLLDFHYHSNILPFIHITKCIKNNSTQGKIGFGYFKSLHKYIFSLKMIPMNLFDLQLYLDNKHKYHLNKFSISKLWMEIFALRWCKLLLLNHLTIHLPLSFSHIFHNSCISLANSQFLPLLNITNCLDPHLLLINEKADYDLKYWCSFNRTLDEWKSCFAQIFFGLWSLQFYSGIIHNDLHWSNILVFKISKGGGWIYQFNDTKYYIKNEGFLFVPWDFGMCSIHSHLITSSIKDPISCIDFLKILNTPFWIQKNYHNIIIPKDIISYCNFIQNSDPNHILDILSLSINFLSLSQSLDLIHQHFILSINNLSFLNQTIGII